MKVFFSCSTKDILKHNQEYQRVRDKIKALGHTLTKEWLDEALKKAKAGKNEMEIAEPVTNSKVMSAILASDVVILDATVKSTAIGYQLACAMEKEKPILFMAQDSQEELNRLFADGADEHLLTVRSYNKDYPERIVEEFLSNNDGRSKVRFNLVMDKHYNNYIEWFAFNNSASKTEVIKKAIDEKMKQDKEYQRYLLKD